MPRSTTTVVSPALLLLLLSPLPGFAAQTFSIDFDSFVDFDADGRIDCSEPVTYRVSLFGTNVTSAGESGTITVPFSDPVRWIYTPGSFAYDPLFSAGCLHTIVSGNSVGDPRLVLDYVCDPMSTNPLDDNYSLVFRVTGLYVSSTAGPIIVNAQNVRTSPDSETQTDTEGSSAPLQPCPPPPDLRLTKTVTSGNGNPGNTLVYTLALTNTGGAAAGVTLEENVPNHTTFSPAGSSPGWACTPNNNAGASCTLSLGTVAAGASLTRTFAVVVDATLPPKPATIDNTACASTNTAGDPPANNCDSTSTPPGGNPDLRMTKTVASGSGNPGATLTYQLVVANQGNRGAAGVTIQENVPSHTTFSPAGSSPGWTCTPNNNAGASCTLSLGTVAAGASLTRTFAVVVDATLPAKPGTFDNTACASTSTAGDPPANNCGSTSTPPGGNPDLRMTKTVASGSGDPGATLAYQLTVTNQGNRDAAGVTLQENVPNHTTFSAAGSSAGWACSPNGNPGSSCTLSLGTVAAGGSLSRTFAVIVDAALPANPGNLDNTACATTSTSGDPAANNCGSTSTPPGGHPDLRVLKTVASGSGDPGATLVYQLALTNQGHRDAAGVTLQDKVPPFTTFSPAGSSPGWSCSPNGGAGSACTLTLGTVAAGASLTRTFAVVVDATLPADPGTIDNTACASTSTPGDPAANNCGSVSTPPGGNPDLELIKTTKAGTTAPGDVLVYQLHLTNRGNRGAADAILRETVPPATTWDAAASSPGWTCSGVSPGSSCFLAVGTVPAGTSLIRDFAVRIANPLPPGTTEIANTACVEADASDPDANNCSTTTHPPGGNPDLHLQKTLASGTVAPDAVLVYDLTLTNDGNREATGVVIEETVPAHTTFEPAASSPGWSCSPGPAAGAACTLAVGSVAAGSSSSFNFAVRVRSDLPSDSQIANTACATQTPAGDDPPGNDCGTLITEPPTQQRTDIEISLGVDEPLQQVGEEFAFVLTLRNTSEVPAQNLRVLVMLPNFGTPPSGIHEACTSIKDLGLECSLPALGAGEQASFTWLQAAFQAGSYIVTADLAEAVPDDVDSTPGNAARTEDDFAEISVEATLQPVVHSIPTLNSGGLVAMSSMLLAVGIAVLFRRRMPQIPPRT